MKKATRPEEQSRLLQGQSSTPANGLLMPRVQVAIKQELVLAHGWKAVGLSPTKGRRAIRRCIKKIGVPAEHIEILLDAMNLGAK